MALVARLMGVERYLEVGTFTGYSALAIALALGPSSTIVTCDIDPDTTRIAQRYWRQAQIAHRIELRWDRPWQPLRACLHKRRAHLTWPSSMPTKKTCLPITGAASNSSVPAV